MLKVEQQLQPMDTQLDNCPVDLNVNLPSLKETKYHDFHLMWKVITMTTPLLGYTMFDSLGWLGATLVQMRRKVPPCIERNNAVTPL